MTENMMVATTDGGGVVLHWPNEAQLQRDIRHFERQIARLASPNSTWERGALKCYQVLASQRRKMLDAVRSGAVAGI